MDAEIDFARPDDENQEEKLDIKPFTKVISNSTNQTILNNALFGTQLPRTRATSRSNPRENSKR